MIKATVIKFSRNDDYNHEYGIAIFNDKEDCIIIIDKEGNKVDSVYSWVSQPHMGAFILPK